MECRVGSVSVVESSTGVRRSPFTVFMKLIIPFALFVAIRTPYEVVNTDITVLPKTSTCPQVGVVSGKAFT